jgi:hypothetical protein
MVTPKHVAQGIGPVRAECGTMADTFDLGTLRKFGVNPSDNEFIDAALNELLP